MPKSISKQIYSMVILDNSIVVDNDDLEQIREYDKDFDYFNDNYDELYRKHRNEFVAVKNRRIFNHKNPLRLLEILNENNVDPVHTIIEFIKDKKIQHPQYRELE